MLSVHAVIVDRLLSIIKIIKIIIKIMITENIIVEKKSGKDFPPLPENIYQCELLDVNLNKRPTYDTRLLPDNMKIYEPEMYGIILYQFICTFQRKRAKINYIKLLKHYWGIKFLPKKKRYWIKISLTLWLVNSAVSGRSTRNRAIRFLTTLKHIILLRQNWLH